MNNKGFSLFAIAVFFMAATGASLRVSAQISGGCRSITNAANSTSENFDTLGTAATNAAVPTGFGFVEGGTSGNATYAGGTGSANGGNTYSFGTAAAPADRAFGTLQSGSVIPILGGCIVNDGTNAISSITITYTGEQYRAGVTTARAGGNDRLDFQYSTTATGISDATFGTAVPLTTLNFTAPVAAAPAASNPFDGNAAANRTAVTSSIALNLPVGGTFFFRFLDINADSSDDGLAIDDFTLSGSFAPPAAATANLGGRITDSRGRGLGNVVLTLTGGALKEPIYATTTSFGYYQFAEVPAGDTYIINVSGKRYHFGEPTRVVSLLENLTDVNFVGTSR